MGLADSKHFLHLVRAMVAEPGAGVQAWAGIADAPVPSAYRIARLFRFHGAISGDRADPRRVLHLGADLRRDKVMPSLELGPKAIPVSLGHLHELRHQLAFQSAANAVAFFEQSDISVRVHAADHDRFTDLLAGPDAAAETEPGVTQSLAVYFEDLDRYPPPTMIDDTPVTDPVITLMDLYSHPRAGAHAEFLDGVLVEAGILPERRR